MNGLSLLVNPFSPWPAAADAPADLTSSSSGDAALGVDPELLAKRCQQGCPDSFSSLVKLFESRIYNFLLRMTRNPHDAQDLTQDTFLKAYKAMDRFDARSSFSTWLFTIAKRSALNHFRSEKRKEKLEPADEADPSADPSVSAEERENCSNLWQIARTLKPQQYEALWLCYGEDFSISETSRIMGLNPIYAKVVLHRARNALEKKLSQKKGVS